MKKVIVIITALAMPAGCGGDSEGQNGANTSTRHPTTTETVGQQTRFEARGAAADKLAMTGSKLPQILEAAPCSWTARIERMRDRALDQVRALKTRPPSKFTPAERNAVVEAVSAESDLIDEWLRYCEGRR